MTKNFNYRTTVHITDQRMKLGFRCVLPEEMEGRRVRVQAVFSGRSIQRRFPMDTVIEDQETGPQIMADAEIELPYVFLNMPRRRVTVTFSLWCGLEEYLLDDQPFPVNRDLFLSEEKERKKKPVSFALSTLALPLILAGRYLTGGHDGKAAMKEVNEAIYRKTGYSYSPRQRHTDYFADCYQSYVRKVGKPEKGNILFLSERLPEPGGNLMLVKEMLEGQPSVSIQEFIHTKTIDKLKRKEIRECARKCAEASVIILEDFYPQLHALNKRRETRIVQLWHACGAFKTFGLTRIGKPGGAPQSSRNHRNYDLVSVSSQPIRNIYAEAFGISPSKVKALGVPRTDALFDPELCRAKREAIYMAYPVLKGKKVVLFAPTFRGDGNKDAYYPADAFDPERFMKALPDDVVLIIKHHPFVKSPAIVGPAYGDRVLDLTGKDHINDLMMVSDLLITDYSSSVFEAVILRLPMLFYAFDEEEYTASRDFYVDYEEFVPGPIAHTFEDLVRKTEEMLRSENSPDYRNFTEAYLGALDGHSTSRIVDCILHELI